MIIIDDFADDPMIPTPVNIETLWHSLFTRGRHCFISSIIATQKFRAINNIIRVNATDLYVFKLRNQGELDAFIEEVSALANKKDLLEMYHLATEEPYSFLYVKLNERDPIKMLMIKVSSYLQLEKT